MHSRAISLLMNIVLDKGQHLSFPIISLDHNVSQKRRVRMKEDGWQQHRWRLRKNNRWAPMAADVPIAIAYEATASTKLRDAVSQPLVKSALCAFFAHNRQKPSSHAALGSLDFRYGTSIV